MKKALKWAALTIGAVWLAWAMVGEAPAELKPIAIAQFLQRLQNITPTPIKVAPAPTPTVQALKPPPIGAKSVGATPAPTVFYPVPPVPPTPTRVPPAATPTKAPAPAAPAATPTVQALKPQPLRMPTMTQTAQTAIAKPTSTPTPSPRREPLSAPPANPVPTPTIQAAPSRGGLYRVNLTRKESNLYKEAGGTLFFTRYCYEYVYGEDAIYDADRAVILFEGDRCDVARVVTKYFESNISGNFEGWDGDTVFRLGNGQVWQQASYSYTYHYAYNPQVIIYEASGNNWMRVQDVDDAIMVRRLR